MVYDLDWSTYSGLTAGTANGLCPAWIQGVSVQAAKTAVVWGTSIIEGNFDYGDSFGTCGVVQRALFSKGYPFVTAAVVGSTIASERTSGGWKMRQLLVSLFTASGGAVIVDSGRNDTGSGWPAAGSYTSAAPNDSTTMADAMAGIRSEALYQLRPAMGFGSKLVRITTVTPGTSGGAFGNAATISAATVSGNTITYLAADTSKLTAGETVAIRGFSPSTWNVTGVVANIIANTSFQITVASGAPTGTPTGTGTVDDGGQITAANPPNAGTTYVSNGAGVRMNDWTASRNSYAGQIFNPSAGDPDGFLDANAAVACSQAPTHPELWASASEYHSMTEEFVHTGWQPNQTGAPVIAPQLAGILGY